ncbi:troponin C, skeletal muscle-like isoform X2 [Ruditapes philippinarum]|uniref:troponin C, skeletal muscle-like isoform X2 n=1 Tax=Ruditapes philippinarum TaxID=129788 RepID=UPI00295B7144|nr:troponin C, skeletal muscle-like isoform X2 [Ruditapes philippinarum]
MEKTLKGIRAPSTIREAFDEWKDKQSNCLTKSKTLNALFEAGQNPIERDINMFWKKKGKSDTDTLGFEEFEELFIQLGNPRDVIRNALKHFDANENGKIDSDELREILKAAGELENTSQVTEDSYVALILSIGDRNKNHELEIDELVTMIQDGLIKR